ncbi:pentapeptide repeat-containing protein [Patescibacteria group bacterium]|nr:pentapeptide repeat-containing protein [Patescibacteria group bacterium]
MSDENKSEWTSPSVEECVAMLKSGPEGVEKWNAMREAHPAWKPDLNRQDLSHVDFFYGNLSNANLSNANLSGADLSGADLSNANLKGADLSRADLSEADLSGADLSKADLSWANFTLACLAEALFAEARTIGVNWWCVNIAGAKGLKSTTVELILATIRDSLG